MTMYLLIALAIALAAAGLWFLARPLARDASPESREQYFQLPAVRDRLLAQLNELDLEERDKNMEAATAADERTRLEAELAAVLKKLDALAPGASTASPKRARKNKSWRWVVAALVLSVPSLATGLYFINATVPPGQLKLAAATPPPSMPDPLQMVARLEQRLQQNPDDVHGWLRLGRSYAVLGRLDDAKAAYAHAYRQLPKDYQPAGAEEYWFLGLAAYTSGETPRALDWWGKLLAAMPPQSEAAKQLQMIIAQAKKKPAPGK